MTAHFLAFTRGQVLRAARACNASWPVHFDFERAMQKWEHQAPADPCRFGAAEQPIALDCRCTGCSELVLFQFFSAAYGRIGPGVERPPE